MGTANLKASNVWIEDALLKLWMQSKESEKKLPQNFTVIKTAIDIHIIIAKASLLH